jgi:6-phosphogluconolactonase/glucosamine-6-phosphate isomerase/deaminase
MQYIRTAGWEDGVADLTQRLVRELAAGHRVLWLTSGGSNIPVSVQIIGNITTELRSNLTVMLADERYGQAGHNQSNWEQLMQAGFKAEPATLLPVLKAGLDFESTIARYEQLAEQAFADHDRIIAQLGIVEDGEIAGILPHSPAVAETKDLVTGYQSTPFLRLTLTFAALRQITAAYTFAFGDIKHRTLTMLQHESVPLSKQPAQILKQLPEAYVYSDQFEENGS